MTGLPTLENPESDLSRTSDAIMWCIEAYGSASLCSWKLMLADSKIRPHASSGLPGMGYRAVTESGYRAVTERLQSGYRYDPTPRTVCQRSFE